MLFLFFTFYTHLSCLPYTTVRCSMISDASHIQIRLDYRVNYPQFNVNEMKSECETKWHQTIAQIPKKERQQRLGKINNNKMKNLYAYQICGIVDRGQCLHTKSTTIKVGKLFYDSLFAEFFLYWLVVLTVLFPAPDINTYTLRSFAS